MKKKEAKANADALNSFMKKLAGEPDNESVDDKNDEDYKPSSKKNAESAEP